MKPLKELPQGSYYVMSGGRYAMDHRGTVHEFSPAGGVGRVTEAEARQPLPDVVRISPRARQEIELAKAQLIDEPHEHFMAFGVDRAGDICMRHRETSNSPVQCDVDCTELVYEAEKSGSVGILSFHNHPGTSNVNFSEADTTLNGLLKHKLLQVNILLLENTAVPGIATAAQERRSVSREGYPERCFEAAMVLEGWHTRQQQMDDEPHWLRQVRQQSRRYAC